MCYRFSLARTPGVKEGLHIKSSFDNAPSSGGMQIPMLVLMLLSLLLLVQLPGCWLMPPLLPLVLLCWWCSLPLLLLLLCACCCLLPYCLRWL